MRNMKTDYASGKTAPDYVCAECRAEGVRLYRPYQTLADHVLLRCTACALKEQGRDATDQPSAHSIGLLVAAVPTESGESYWGYTSVPDAAVDWWDGLPVNGDIDTLSGPGLSEAVAREVMGWEYIPPVIHEPVFAHRNTEPGWRVDGGKLLASDWKPHEDRNDAHRVLMRCWELGIAVKIWDSLCRIGPRGIFEGDWFLMTTDPAIVCRAALRAVRASR